MSTQSSTATNPTGDYHKLPPVTEEGAARGNYQNISMLPSKNSGTPSPPRDAISTNSATPPSVGPPGRRPKAPAPPPPTAQFYSTLPKSGGQEGGSPRDSPHSRNFKTLPSLNNGSADDASLSRQASNSRAMFQDDLNPYDNVNVDDDDDGDDDDDDVISGKLSTGSSNVVTSGGYQQSTSSLDSELYQHRHNNNKTSHPDQLLGGNHDTGDGATTILSSSSNATSSLSLSRPDSTIQATAGPSPPLPPSTPDDPVICGPLRSSPAPIAPQEDLSSSDLLPYQKNSVSVTDSVSDNRGASVRSGQISLSDLNDGVVLRRGSGRPGEPPPLPDEPPAQHRLSSATSGHRKSASVGGARNHHHSQKVPRGRHFPDSSSDSGTTPVPGVVLRTSASFNRRHRSTRADLGEVDYRHTLRHNMEVEENIGDHRDHRFTYQPGMVAKNDTSYSSEVTGPQRPDAAGPVALPRVSLTKTHHSTPPTNGSALNDEISRNLSSLISGSEFRITSHDVTDSPSDPTTPEINNDPNNDHSSPNNANNNNIDNTDTCVVRKPMRQSAAVTRSQPASGMSRPSHSAHRMTSTPVGPTDPGDPTGSRESVPEEPVHYSNNNNNNSNNTNNVNTSLVNDNQAPVSRPSAGPVRPKPPVPSKPVHGSSRGSSGDHYDPSQVSRL